MLDDVKSLTHKKPQQLLVSMSWTNMCTDVPQMHYITKDITRTLFCFVNNSGYKSIA